MPTTLGISSGGGGSVSITYVWDFVTTNDADGNLRSANGQKLPSTLKGSNPPWLVVGYPISSNWNGSAGSGNGGAGPDATLLGQQCNRYEGANATKWLDQENAVQAPTPATVDWSLIDAITNVINTNPGTSGQGFVLNFHLVIGQDIYNPSYATAQLGTTPGNILALVQWRIDQITAHYTDPAIDRFDVLNEILAGTSATIATSGWRTAGVAFYTASQDATTLTNVLGGLAEYWFWTMFTQLRAAYPSARLAWTDFTVASWNSPTDSFQGPPPNSSAQQANYYLYWGNNAAVFADNNSSYISRFAYDRFVYEAWRMKLAQVPIDVVGLQSHVDYFAPVDEVALAWACWEFNGLGVAPAITEMSVSWFKSSNIPPQISVGTVNAPSYNAAVYGAWYIRRYLDVILRESACTEVSGWTNDANSQAIFMLSTTYPILGQAMLACNAAVSPTERLLKRSRRTEFRQTQLPLWCSLTGGDATALSFSSRRLALTGGRSIQIPFAWYGSARINRPITSTAMTLVMSFFVSIGGLTAGNVLFGHGVLPSTAFAGEAFGTGDGVTTVFTHTAANTPVKPGSVTITVGGVTGTDDGNGTLNSIGSVRGTGVVIGSINYATGLMTIIFSAAPANLAAITTTYKQAGATVPADSAMVTAGAGNIVVVTVLVATVSKLSLSIGTLQPDEINVVAVRFDGVDICGSVNGGSVTSGVATAALTAPDTIFVASLPDSSGTNPNLGTMTFDVHSNLDYQETWMVRELAQRKPPTGPRVLTLPFFAG